MISYMLQVMNTVRVNLLEGFILPELNISYWDFIIALLIIGLLIKVLVNSVKKEQAKAQKQKSGKNKGNSNNKKGS